MFKRSESSVPCSGRIARLACAAGLAGTLAAGSTLAAPVSAYAASAQTLSELSRLQQQVQNAADTYADATGKADDLNAQAAEIAQDILNIEQDKLPVRQKKAANAARDLYKMQTSPTSTMAMLLTSSSLSDFFTMTKYLASIQDDQVAALDELNELEDELNGKLSDMSQAKTDAEKARQQASDALAQAQAAAEKIQQKANAENAAEAQAARQAAEQAAKLAEQEAARQQNGGAGNVNSDGNAGADAGSNAGGTQSPAPSPETQQPTQPQQPSGDQQGGGSASGQGGWLSGQASYYGIGDGFMGGTTASGAIVTETSMGVAMLNVPLGTMVEISYNGKSVVAVVNDRGPYAHGRVIDMQPAVARALDFLSVGVGTVQYRFL